MYFSNYIFCVFLRNPDYMLIENQENGNYTAHWIPTVPGVYSVQLFVDGRHTGELKHILQCTEATST